MRQFLFINGILTTKLLSPLGESSLVVDNTELSSGKVVISYERCGIAKNYNKETKYDWYTPSRSGKVMAVGHLLLKSFWVNTLKNRARVKPFFR